jgi:hypothetical protein
MAPLSCSTQIAQPRRLRIDGRLSFVVSIENRSSRDESFAPALVPRG